jgi:tetratricopeptide (TPR) repeat protein
LGALLLLWIPKFFSIPDERGILAVKLEERLQIGYASQSHPDLPPEPSLEALQIARQLQAEGSTGTYEQTLSDLAEGRYSNVRAKTEARLRGNEAGLLSDYVVMGRLEAYTGHYEASANYFTKALHLGGSDFAVSSDLARVRLIEGKYTEAEDIAKRLIATESSNEAPSREVLARAFSLRGSAAYFEGRFSDAVNHYRTAYRYWSQVPNPDPTAFSDTLNDLGQTLDEVGHYEEGRPFLDRALEIRKKAKYVSILDLSESYNDIGLSLKRKKMYSQALPYYQQAYRLLLDHFGSNHPAIAMQANNIGSLYFSQERYTEAKREYIRALTLWEKFLGPRHLDVARGYTNLATCFQKLHQFEKAEESYRKSLAILVSDPKLMNHPYHAIVLLNEAALYAEQGHQEMMEKFLWEAWPIMTPVPPESHVATGFFNGVLKLCRSYGCSRDLMSIVRQPTKIARH